ncbi:SRPBCC family protein [Pseudonocardia nigra]|uniref:SRPBCC family protein n=1 Tax=Pseudonocardia nigra TaxID=1921578 RepID=UPI001C5F6267|nr:SRPBCC family protein [Pseudonocardia nigra]
MDEVDVVIAAPPEQVWALVTDITRMGEWSPENRGGRWTAGATGSAVGARFVGVNAHGPIRWRTRCRVVECAPPSRFAFTVAESGMTWGWRLEPAGTGTRLVQWRERTGRSTLLARLVVRTGVLGRAREELMVDGMRRTLAAVRATAEARAAAG